MKDLQLALFKTGAVFIVAIILYNFWRIYRFKFSLKRLKAQRNQRNAGNTDHSDRIEPTGQFMTHNSNNEENPGALNQKTSDNRVEPNKFQKKPSYGLVRRFFDGFRHLFVGNVKKTLQIFSRGVESKKTDNYITKQEKQKRIEPSLARIDIPQEGQEPPERHAPAFYAADGDTQSRFEASSQASSDALFEGASQAPFDAVSQALFEAPQASFQAPSEATLEASSPAVTAVTAVKSSRSVRIDPLIDTVVLLKLTTPVDAQKIITWLNEHRCIDGRAIYAEAQVAHEAYDERAAAWICVQSVPPAASLSSVRIAMQLSQRIGPIDEQIFSKFINIINELSYDLQVFPSIEDMKETIDRAQILDARIRQSDVQLSINILAKKTWDVAVLGASLAQDPTLKYSKQHRCFHKISEQFSPLFTLSWEENSPLSSINAIEETVEQKTAESTAESENATKSSYTDSYAGSYTNSYTDCITLVLDVPRVEAASEPFQTLWDYGCALAAQLDGQLVDDNRRPLTEAALLGIKNQLRAFYKRLEDEGFPAGSPTALRLFS